MSSLSVGTGSMISTIMLACITLVNILAKHTTFLNVIFSLASKIAFSTVTAIASYSVSAEGVVSTDPGDRAALVHVHAGGHRAVGGEIARKTNTKITI